MRACSFDYAKNVSTKSTNYVIYLLSKCSSLSVLCLDINLAATTDLLLIFKTFLKAEWALINDVRNILEIFIKDNAAANVYFGTASIEQILRKLRMCSKSITFSNFIQNLQNSKLHLILLLAQLLAIQY